MSTLVNNTHESSTLITKIDGLKKYSTLSVEKIKLLMEKLDEFEKYGDSLFNLDLSLAEYMYDSRKTNEIVTNTKFQDVMESLSEDSLTVYVSKAQLYKVYNVDNLDDFENDDGTIYRKPEYGPVHEVVRDSHPQKLTIVFKDVIALDKITIIKNYIATYIQKNAAFANFKPSDVTVYYYDNTTEFLISYLRMADISAKEKMVENFIKFMKSKGELVLSKLIEVKHPACDELDGARFYKLPSAKNPVDHNTINIIDQLITTAAPVKNKQPMVINNTFIIQNNNSNNTNNINTVNNIKIDNASEKTLKSYYKYLYDTKPTWYVENGKVDMTIIEQSYRAYFNDYGTIKSIISRQLNGKLFHLAGAKRTTNKVLVSFEQLKQLYTQ